MQHGRVDIDAGICLHETSAVASTDCMRMVTFEMETTCANVERLMEIVASGEAIDAYHEVGTRVESAIVAAGKTARVCTDCGVPVSLIKALRIAAGLAMVKDVNISLAGETRPWPDGSVTAGPRQGTGLSSFPPCHEADQPRQ